jgi:hypothetical protein
VLGRRKIDEVVQDGDQATKYAGRLGALTIDIDLKAGGGPQAVVGKRRSGGERVVPQGGADQRPFATRTMRGRVGFGRRRFAIGQAR